MQQLSRNGAVRGRRWNDPSYKGIRLDRIELPDQIEAGHNMKLSMRSAFSCQTGKFTGSTFMDLFGYPLNFPSGVAHSTASFLRGLTLPSIRISLVFASPSLVTVANMHLLDQALDFTRKIYSKKNAMGIGRVRWMVADNVPAKLVNLCDVTELEDQSSLFGLIGKNKLAETLGFFGSSQVGGEVIVVIVASLYTAGATVPDPCPDDKFAFDGPEKPGTVFVQIATTCLNGAAAPVQSNSLLLGEIIAHEIGHALGLCHVDASKFPTNLMNAGGNETTTDLTDGQISWLQPWVKKLGVSCAITA